MCVKRWKRWEPRITLEKVEVALGDYDHGQLIINIAYKLKGSTRYTQLSLSFLPVTRIKKALLHGT